jgi:hypothetical protein
MISFSPKEVLKLNSDQVAKMDHLVHDSLLWQCPLDKFRREPEPKEVLDWAIQMMQCKANRVKTLVDQVMQLGCSICPTTIMKLKADVVDKIDELANDPF